MIYGMDEIALVGIIAYVVKSGLITGVICAGLIRIFRRIF